MYGNHSYHIIDHFTPPTLAADKNFQDTLLRLEDITACSIVKYENKCNILSKIPWHLHTVIWKAYLGDKFYSYIDSVRHYTMLQLEDLSFLDFSDLSELLYHWPNEVLTLKEVMPRFPSKLSLWGHFLDEGSVRDWKYGPDWMYGPPLHRTRTLLQYFYHKVSDAVFENFIKTKSKKFGNTHKDGCKIRKLDISGFAFMWHHKNEDRHLLKYIKSGENPFGNTPDNIEVIIDAEILLKHDKILNNDEHLFSDDDEYESDIEDTEDFNYEEVKDVNNEDEDNINDEDKEDSNENKSPLLASSYANSSNSIFSYGHLKLGTNRCTKNSVQIIKKMISERTRSFYIEEIPIDTAKFIKDVFESPFNQNIMTLGVCGRVYSIDFLNYFKNLKHLDLSRQNLHGKLNPLLHMEKGLRSLDLRACKLSNSDLDVLLKSCHKSSLLELNISFNKFNDNSTNLIMLCQALPYVITLHLENCSLGKLSNNDLRNLCDSFNSLPNLAYLNLHDNDFSMDIIKSHLISLSASPSLRLLLLAEAETEQESLLITTMMNQKRSELLYVQAGGYC